VINNKNLMNSPNKYYKASPKVKCNICGLEYFSGYQSRHEKSKTHLIATSIVLKMYQQQIIRVLPDHPQPLVS